MVDIQRSTVYIASTLLFILYLQLPSLDAKKSKRECPIGFQLATSKSKDDKICYSLMEGPFGAKFDNCAGNVFTLRLYNSLILPKSESTLWTDYKSMYPGGPFVDWSYTNSMGDILETTYEVNRDPYLSIVDELCVAIDPVSNFTAVRCDEKHYRYCFVKPYSDDKATDDCDELNDSIRFWSPLPMCLMSVAGEAAGGRGGIRTTWTQSQKSCERRGGSMLGRGWRYSNYFEPTGTSDAELPMYPLNIIFNSNHTLLKYGYENDTSDIPVTDWHFDSSIMVNDNFYGAINNNDFWDLVNSSYVFYNVICEKTINLKHINLTVSIDSGDLITLKVNDTSLKKDNIKCFTDSLLHFPHKVPVEPHSSDPYVYILKAMQNGYYWCTHTDSRNFYITESNKTLFVKVKESTENLYAVKINMFEEYKLDVIGKLIEKVWKKKLEQYVYYSNKYGEVYDGSESYDNFTIMNFKNDHPGLRWEDQDIIQKVQLKRLYLDARTALLHVELYPNVKPVKPGQWQNLVIEYMKPVYYCDKDKKLNLGISYSSPDCKIYTCVGDYNEGVQTIITPQDNCYLPAPVKTQTILNVNEVTPMMPTPFTSYDQQRRDGSSSDSSEEFIPTFERTSDLPGATTQYVEMTTDMVTITDNSYEVSTVSNEVLTVDSPTKLPKPTTTPRPIPPTPESTQPPTDTPSTLRPPPDQQLQQVMSDLEHLLHNNTEQVLVEDIADAFTQVDEILYLQEVEIPGNLLHLLDELGSRINLNGSDKRTAVRENIALLVADAQPSLPVRGLRVAARASDYFTNDTFEIIRGDINSTQLQADESEVFVALPVSVSATLRRVSFVVFRNDRAFAPGYELYSVNSRVLSVNIENVTEFHEGEVIDIHLMPITEDPDRNQSRACAYWHFNADGSGFWSQEGCTFIRARQPGMLDTCRCDHLTHFAEVLVPRTVFSENDETTLEIITVVGCCMSILGLLLVGLTALLFRSWRRDYSNKIWLQLCSAILLLCICFLVVVYAPFEERDVLCPVTGIVLHYSVLASFCWMLVAAVLSYKRLVTVFTRDTSHKLLKASAFAWGAPCAAVGLLLSIAPQSYAGRFEDKSPSGAFCYPTGLALWLGVYAPIAVMLLTNWTLFALIVRSVFASRRIQRHGSDSNEAFRCASVSCLLVFLFGLPWLFGLFSFNVVAAYFFTILVSFQGFVLFLFFVLGNKKTRDLWLNKLKIKQTRKVPVTSSTYTNRSTGANIPSRGHKTPATIEANATKPKSLNSSDNSRFS